MRVSGFFHHPRWAMLREPKTWAILLLGVLAVRWLYVVFFEVLCIDEIEHTHSAWLVLQGDLPYRDFFQHHHPLFWYVLSPVVALVGETASIIHVLHLLQIGWAIGTLYLVYRLARDVSGSELGGWVAAILLISTSVYLDNGAEIRPDVPQVFFSTLAAFTYIQYLRYQRPRDLILAGLSVSLSFLFLQKALFTGAALVFAASYEAIIRRAIPWRVFVGFLLAGAVPLVLFASILWLAGLWPEYVFFNYTININKNNPWWSFVHFFIQDRRHFPYWVLTIWAVLLAFFRPGTNRTVRVLAWFVVWQIFFLLFVKYSSRHYLLQWTAFSMPVLGWAIAHYFGANARWARFGRVAAICVGVFCLAIAYTYPLLPNRPQILKMQYVLDHSSPEDTVYDGRPEYNLFRRDLHYFWYSVGIFQNLWVYQQLTGKYPDYDIRTLILDQRPKIISNFQIHIHEGELKRRYEATPFENLYLLRPEFDLKEQHE